MTRRQFIRIVMLAVMVLSLGNVATSAASSRVPEQPTLKILILGGTGFIGPWEIKAALAQGHEVTLFNRGKTRPDMFPDLVRLKGDRDPDVGEGLAALAGRTFDVVIDNSGYYPRHVKASAELLGPNVGHYIYISSISAYGITSVEGQDVDAPVATMEDPTAEEMGENYENYGPLKALCEQAAQDAMPGRVTVVRPGFIVGPGDHTHRFTYWPLRVRQGGDMAVPGTPDDPVQFIDVRDLTEWIIRLAEMQVGGVFNGSGPDRVLTMGEMLETAKLAIGSDVTLTWLGYEFQDDFPNTYFPIWTPYEGEYKGFHTFNVSKSIDAGLTFRPLAETVTATLEAFDNLPEEQQAAALARIPVEGESDIVEKAHSWTE